MVSAPSAPSKGQVCRHCGRQPDGPATLADALRDETADLRMFSDHFGDELQCELDLPTGLLLELAVEVRRLTKGVVTVLDRLDEAKGKAWQRRNGKPARN